MLVDSAVYTDGRPTTATTLEEAYRVGREPGKFAWVTLQEPTEEEFASVAEQFGLDELAVRDASEPHQRPKIERYGERLFAVLKPARYVEGSGSIEFSEIRAFVEADFILAVLYGRDATLGSVREELESDPGRLRRGPTTILCEIMSRAVEGYALVVEGLENGIDEVEEEVLGGNLGVSPRIHRLSREVIRFHQATKPLAGAVERLIVSGAEDLYPEERKYLRRVRDKVLRVTEQIEGFRDLLSSIIDMNLTMVGTLQNDQMQKLSAWGAILVVPTLIAGIFGMNFEEAWWIQARYGFEGMVILMGLISGLLYLGFKRSGWL
jgi:magnesium transporter